MSHTFSHRAPFGMLLASRMGRGGWGPFPGFRPPFGPHGGGGQWGHWAPPWAPGTRARRGDVRAAILAVLADGPRNGYQVIGEIAERSGGAWRPSPGSVYPTLSQLEDEGLVEAPEGSGRRVFALTDAGRAYVAEHAEEIAAPFRFEDNAGPESWHDLIGDFKHIAMAATQIAQSGDDAQRAEARRILGEARRGLYRILGGDEGDDGS
jgi:DNA-binding PadR family transcriptional regulator